MGTNSSEGLVNDRLDLFGYPNMYIVDGSILQANQEVNSSFSITAFAEYAMDQIPEKSDNKNIPLEKQLKVLAEVLLRTNIVILSLSKDRQYLNFLLGIGLPILITFQKFIPACLNHFIGSIEFKSFTSSFWNFYQNIRNMLFKD